MKGAPRSEQFNDVYFSADNGLEETRHVFIKGNGLPAAWQAKESHNQAFTITETGFGTGLNFLCTWKLFSETAHPKQTLDFISIEKHPVTPDFIRNALAPWRDELGDYIDKFLEHYPIRISGFHRVKLTPQITLTLIFDDIKQAIPSLQASIDCWFLDGFTPAKNPDMWCPELYENMARLSHNQTTFATFTAAGDVKRCLQNAGFDVQKAKGFGRKRDMLVGNFKKDMSTKLPIRSKGKIAIIGGGLAGTACAYTLKQYGFTPVIYEAGNNLAAGASGNSLGLYNPRFSKLRDTLSDFFAPAYAQFIRTAQQASTAIEYTPCGTLHLLHDEDKATRYKSMIEHWGWYEDHVQLLNTKQASEVAGIPIDYEALYLPDSGSVSPYKLCHYYAQDIEVRLGTHIDDDIIHKMSVDYDTVILTGGSALHKSSYLSWLETDIIRGQVSYIKATDQSRSIQCNINYNGYITPAYSNIHTIGSSFDKNNDNIDILEQDHQINLDKLRDGIPSLNIENIDISNGWVGTRLATRDRFPVVGAIPNEKNLYISTAFGSHGLIGSIAAANLLADQLREGPLSLSMETAYALSPQRFIDRAAKKGRILL